jgi:hypothetical protein
MTKGLWSGEEWPEERKAQNKGLIYGGNPAA